jgi:phosphatidylserine/phosphatidylglycerophosphate/cardiolipin synthase-like enzyme
MSDHIPHTDSPRVNLGAARCQDGYFLRRPVVQKPFTRSEDRRDSAWTFCSTFRNSDMTLRKAVLEMIRGARRKVFVTSFILGDDELIDALVAAANRLTGGVYVIVELSERNLSRGLADLANQEEKQADIGQKVEAEKKRFLSLTARGIAVRGHEDCHAKFVVVDDAVAWVGSANLETRAFTENGEVGVTTTAPDAVTALARMFARMWLEGCRYELPSNTTYTVENRRGTPVPFTVPAAAPTAAPTLLWTDTEHANILVAAHDVINGAHERLLLASWSLNGMAKRPDLLLEPLRDAIKRGVEVDMLVRAMNFRDRHRADAGLLTDLGVRIVADDLNHAKAVVADEQRGLLFSANFDAQHGLDAGSGIEIGARLDGTLALTDLVQYLDHAMATATRAYVPAPTSRQLDTGLDATWQEPWPMPLDIRVQAQQHHWHQLSNAVSRGPALWTQHRGKLVELQIDQLRFQLVPQPDRTSYQLEQLPMATASTDAVLAGWWRMYNAGYSRGLCPAVFTLIQ